MCDCGERLEEASLPPLSNLACSTGEKHRVACLFRTSANRSIPESGFFGTTKRRFSGLHDMDLVTLTVATEKVEFRCNAELSDSDRTSTIERMTRLAQAYPEIVRMYVDVERDADADFFSFIAKGQIEMEGPNVLASVADENAAKCVEFLLENFDRQLRRRSLPRARTMLRAPRSAQSSRGSARPFGPPPRVEGSDVL